MDYFGDFTGLYFYSTVVQGNMALLALASLFAVFRLQVLYGLRQTANEKIVYFIKEYFQQGGGLPEWLHQHSWGADQLLHTLRGFKGGPDYGETDLALAKGILADGHFTQLVLEKSVLEVFQKDVTNGLQRPLLLTVIVTGLALVLLPFSAPIHRMGTWHEAGCFALLIALNVWSLIENIRFVLKTLRHGHPVLG